MKEEIIAELLKDKDSKNTENHERKLLDF